MRSVLNAAGSVVDRITNDAFGGVAAETNPSAGGRFKYTSREWDGEIGLQYNRARYYDPSTGRWISQDPIGFAGGDANWYRYVGNSLVRVGVRTIRVCNGSLDGIRMQ